VKALGTNQSCDERIVDWDRRAFTLRSLTVWTARVEAQNPDALAAVEMDQTMPDWGVSTLQALKRVLENSDKAGGSAIPKAACLSK